VFVGSKTETQNSQFIKLTKERKLESTFGQESWNLFLLSFLSLLIPAALFRFLSMFWARSPRTSFNVKW